METAEPQEPAALDPESRLIELRRLSAEDPAGRWFLPLGALLLELDLATEAQRAVRQGLALDPDCLSGWVLLGRSYWMSGEAAAARRIMASVLARDPENAHALRVHAQAQIQLGESRAAIRDYRALLRLVPGDVAAQDALAQLLDHEAGAPHGEPAPVPVVSGEHKEAPMPLAEALTSSGKERAPSRGPLKRKSGTRERAPRPAAKLESRPRTAVASSGRTVLPPARRPKAGIFESLPADLDWSRNRAPRPSAPASSPPAPPADPERPRQGYRRWLDRLYADQGQDGSREPDSGADR
jgi:hypothetical protein